MPNLQVQVIDPILSNVNLYAETETFHLFWIAIRRQTGTFEFTLRHFIMYSLLRLRNRN